MKRRKVFLSFAGDDRPIAMRLADDLRRYGVEALVDARDVALGADIVLWVNQALTESDYCVLLWSRNCVDRQWVEGEWAAAYAKGLNEGRVFLFVVRLDETPLPQLLTVRRYLDGFPDWTAVASSLATAWYGDLAVDTPVFPSPHQPHPARPTDPPAVIAVIVRNQAMRVSHTVGVPSDSTGAELLPTIRTALALPDSHSQLNGVLKLQFSYGLQRNDDQIPDTPITAQGITDNTVLDLEVRFELKVRPGTEGPAEQIAKTVFRNPGDAPPGVSDKSIRLMVRDAFKHLLP